MTAGEPTTEQAVDQSKAQAKLAYHEVTRSVSSFLAEHGMGVSGQVKVLVGVSGGADSVGLLRVLALLSGRRGWGLQLIVGHVQHHLRGKAAEDDAQWVASLSEQLGVPFERADVSVGQGNLEDEARQSRYAALASLARAKGVGLVMTAHTASDQLETLLMRVCRGSGLVGLQGIAARRELITETKDGLSKQVMLCRPMLAVTREQVRSMLAEIGQGWREDASNFDAEHRTRARLRRDVLPALLDLYPGAERAASRLTQELSNWTSDELFALEKASGDWVTDRAAARLLPKGYLGQLLRMGLGEAGVPLGGVNAAQLGAMVSAVCDQKGGSRRFDLADGWGLVVTRERVVLTQSDRCEADR